jgi:hypothetical protein
MAPQIILSGVNIQDGDFFGFPSKTKAALMIFLLGIYWKYLVMALILKFKYYFLENQEKVSSKKSLVVGWIENLN